MNLIETELTPELAARLLASAHSSQRRPATLIVATYARAIKEGRWVLIADPILVAPAEPGSTEGQMFNGGHRCAAVIAAHRSIPVMICWDADPTTFDVIDVGRKRSAYQFITETEAALRASAARVTLWYERRFDTSLQPRHMAFDLHEIMAESNRRSASFDAMVGPTRKTYEYTSLTPSVVLGAYTIAFDMGYQEQIEAFVNGIEDPAYLPPNDPCRLLTERFRKEAHRGHRRQLVEDWTILVRALNLHLEGKTASRLVMSEFWPLVAESDIDWNRRRNTASAARKTHAYGASRESQKASGAA